MEFIHVNVTGPTPSIGTYDNVVLKSNIDFKNQIKNANTIYHVKWDFDLGGETVNMYQNCVLIMEGGRITNGTIRGADTMLIYHTPKESAFVRVVFTGTWKDADMTKVNDEDLSLNNDGEIQFADKQYDPNHFSGLGRKYLRKNIVSQSSDQEEIGSWVIYTNEDNNKVLVFYYMGKFYLPYRKVKKEKVIFVLDGHNCGSYQYHVDSDSQIVKDLDLTTNGQFLYFDDDTYDVVLPGGAVINAGEVIESAWPLDDWTVYNGTNILT